LGVLSLGLLAFFFLAPVSSLPKSEYPPAAGSGGGILISCDHTTYIISRQPSLSAATLGYGVVRFELTKYPPESCSWIYAPHASTYWIRTWDLSNVSQYLR
jgi:hypothetical protein